MLRAANLDGNPGGGFIRFSLTAAQLNIASNVSTGDSIEVVIIAMSIADKMLKWWDSGVVKIQVFLGKKKT